MYQWRAETLIRLQDEKNDLAYAFHMTKILHHDKTGLQRYANCVQNIYLDPVTCVKFHF